MGTLIPITIGAFAWWAPAASAGEAVGAHVVRVQVLPISQVAVLGGDVSLVAWVGDGVADLSDAADATTCDLTWLTNETAQKITVSTDRAPSGVTLTVEAANTVGGRAAGPVALGTAPQDFVTGIARVRGRCDLKYSAVPLPGVRAPLAEALVVSYTLTDEH